MHLNVLDQTPGPVVAQLAEVFRREEEFEKVMARIRQRKAAADLGQNRKSIQGLGAPVLEVDSYAYHYWGQRLGYKCWRDKAFVREFKRDNPDARVKAIGTKEVHVGYRAPSDGRSGLTAEPVVCNSRFKKSYG